MHARREYIWIEDRASSATWCLQQLAPVRVWRAQAGELVAHDVCSGASQSHAVRSAHSGQREFDCHRRTTVMRRRGPVVHERLVQNCSRRARA
eukprot:5608032-Prymnesium_polylepis.3